MSQLWRKKVAIIGSGIIGLSSAICLQDTEPSLDITIIAEKFSPDNTSDGGAGVWWPVPGYWMKDTDRRKQRQWGEATFHYLKSIIESDEMCAYQMSYLTGYTVYDQAMQEETPVKDVCIFYKRLSREELKKLGFPSDIIDGFMMKSMMFPATPYLQIKLKQFQNNGGKVIRRKVNSFDELAGEYDVVVNCTGLGARELCKDYKLEPERGQILRMHAPWLNHFYSIKRKKDADAGKTTYIFPRFKDVVVGGTYQRGNWDTNVDSKETQAILDRVAEFEPSIKNASIIDEWVGLRPVRPSVRLEKEVINVTLQNGSKLKLPIVHNYGHGGAGLSLFWGCAKETRDIVLRTLLHSSL